MGRRDKELEAAHSLDDEELQQRIVDRIEDLPGCAIKELRIGAEERI